jgi:Holliday junction DNA helicase RuvA
MIAHIDGRLAEKDPTYVVIDCGGVGYHLNITLNTYSKIGDSERIKLITHMVVREDAQILYGFFDYEERAIFRQLISVSGVGASTARVILSSMTPKEVQQAIVGGDASTLKRVKGIGGKSALRIIVDLKDKLEKEGLIFNDNFVGSNNTTKNEALSALVTLGFDKRAAEKAVDKFLNETDSDLSVEELIKLALKSF